MKIIKSAIACLCLAALVAGCSFGSSKAAKSSMAEVHDSATTANIEAKKTGDAVDSTVQAEYEGDFSHMQKLDLAY